MRRRQLDRETSTPVVAIGLFLDCTPIILCVRGPRPSRSDEGPSSFDDLYEYAALDSQH